MTQKKTVWDEALDQVWERFAQRDDAIIAKMMTLAEQAEPGRQEMTASETIAVMSLRAEITGLALDRKQFAAALLWHGLNSPGPP